MKAFFRRRLLFRVIMNGVILLIVAAAGFLALASLLIGDEARRAERTMATWFANGACDDYAKSPGVRVLATYPVAVTIHSKEGTVLATSTSEDLRATRVVCADGSGRYVVVGEPLQEPPLGRLSLSVAAMVLLVAIGSIPLARSLVKPVRELVATATRFGEGELSARAPVGRTDEIGDLATAFNAMAEKLEARIRAEKEMLANVSHELRTPLARVRVVLETVKEDPQRAALLFGEISRDLAELERLTDDVLATVRMDFERSERGTSPGLLLRPENVDVTGVLRQVIARSVEADPSHEIELDAADAIPRLRADPALLRRLFENVLDNARKYSSSSVTVRVRDERDAVVVDILDRGIGVEAADLERIFEPFFRSDRSRQRATGGTGLGLALCRRIVELHGGTIAASSEPEGGTTVSIRLPRA